MLQLSRELRSELKVQGISVSIVCPNGIETIMAPAKGYKLRSDEKINPDRYDKTGYI